MKIVILSIVLVAGSIITSLAQDQSQPSVTVRWQKEIKQPLDAGGNLQSGLKEEPPPILYEKAPTTTNTLALIRVNFSYTKEGAKETKNIVGGPALEFSIPASSGIITNTGWYYASVFILGLEGIHGTGTVHIAFFEPSKNSSGKDDASGRQLSNWLDLPIILPNTGMPSVFGK